VIIGSDMEIKISSQIILRSLCFADSKAIFHILDSQRRVLRRWLPFVDATHQLSDSEAFVNYTIESQEPTFSIFYHHEFIGLIGMKSTEKQNQKTEIGYWLSVDYHNLGIMTAAVKELCEYAYNCLNINRIQIKCAIGNLPSKKIPQKLGFTLEGIERDGELLCDGKFTDIEVYSLLKSEWKTSQIFNEKSN
jgi:Acetyltransferases, including N-acetylases of ribosomal proteins